jgi:serine/threonine protein kinase
MTEISLEGLVSKGKTKEAIEQLRGLIEDLSKEPLNNLIQLQGRYSSVNKVEVMNTEDKPTTRVEFNRIDLAFLNILTEVRTEIQANINFFKPIPKENEGKDVLGDFLATVLAKKYINITHYAHGNTFIYFNAKEKHSGLDVMIMILKSSDIKNVIDNKFLAKIAQLKHRNLIQLLDVNFQTYPYYIITEYVSGISLKTLMANIGQLPLQNAKKLLLIVGDVMNTLRLKKFPYAGIRPSKILIDHELEPEISPFDILKVDNDKRLLKSFVEDSYYFAPEKLYDISDNPRYDGTDKANQFCLAALGYEMITGEKLFTGKSIADILMMRNRFFTDIEFRKAKLAHPRLVNRIATIFKKMLNEDPDKRYDDMPSALKEIAKVRVPMNVDEERVFNSYRRSLDYTENFIDKFYENLFSNQDLATEKPLGSDKNPALVEKFYIDINLVFGIENFSTFVEKIATLQQGEHNPMKEYPLFLDAFIKTISECDPRWHSNKDVEKSWNHIRNTVLAQLATLPVEPETMSNFGFPVLPKNEEGSTDSEEKAPDETPQVTEAKVDTQFHHGTSGEG